MHRIAKLALLLATVIAPTIAVAAPLAIIAPATSTAPLGKLAFTATGGSGVYDWHVSINGSGGTIDGNTGAYQAGATGSVIDRVTVHESLGTTASVDIMVTPALALTSPMSAVPPMGTQTFTATGGAGGYVFKIIFPGSGMPTIDPMTGVYVAGAMGSIYDRIQVLDRNGAVAVAQITVTAGVTIDPVPAQLPGAQVTLHAQGGSNSGFVWGMATNGSGGTVDAHSGLYSAGMTSDSSDVVQVTDSLANVATVKIWVGIAPLTIEAATPTTPPRGHVQFIAMGGYGTYHWSLTSNDHGASLDPLSGLYIAGPLGNVTDKITVTDATNAQATAMINVSAPISLNPPSAKLGAGDFISFSAHGGDVGPYSWSLTANGSGGRIDSTGVYVAGPNSGTDTVHVQDDLDNVADAEVVVTAHEPMGGKVGDSDGGAGNLPDASIGLPPFPDWPTKHGGCGCDLGAATESSSAFAVVALLLLAFWRRRATSA